MYTAPFLNDMRHGTHTYLPAMLHALMAELSEEVRAEGFALMLGSLA